MCSYVCVNVCVLLYTCWCKHDNEFIVYVVVEQMLCIYCCIYGVVFLVLKNVGVTMVLKICCVYVVADGVAYMWLYRWCCVGVTVYVLV